MKTAYELAMERLGLKSENYTDKQKGELAEIDRVYDAKVAEAKLASESRLTDTGDDKDKLDEIRKDLARELAFIERKRESKKDAVRKRSR